ncbi:hypothetical protein L5515_006892 [Caenorhabditis briggsae]|uniref:Seven TM Receptor n=1 Tax=Caenorhabditis briggsae TaxID=6238 RepID=A0AAE9F3N5_CAEBR|nr:hypothetical protein L5515_006892 [Caenorhabditis briggsae]
MHHFQGLSLLKIYTVPLFLFVLWYLTVTIPLGPTDVKAEYMRESIQQIYGDDTFKLSYVGALYYYTDSSKDLIINWQDFGGAFTLCGIMQLCISTMMICGWKTFKKLKSVGASMSPKTKELNNQLFKALVFQTLIPLCIMFGPVGALYILPMFSINIGKLANAPSLYAGFYPALDALVAILMIRDYRDTVLCKKSKIKSHGSVVPATHQSSNFAQTE